MRVGVHCTFVKKPCVQTMNHSTSNYELGKYTRCSITQLHQHYFLKCVKYTSLPVFLLCVVFPYFPLRDIFIENVLFSH